MKCAGLSANRIELIGKSLSESRSRDFWKSADSLSLNVDAVHLPLS